MEWRPVRGFEGEYLVSDSGDIKSVTRNVPNKANRITEMWRKAPAFRHGDISRPCSPTFYCIRCLLVV